MLGNNSLILTVEFEGFGNLKIDYTPRRIMLYAWANNPCRGQIKSAAWPTGREDSIRRSAVYLKRDPNFNGECRHPQTNCNPHL